MSEQRKKVIVAPGPRTGPCEYDADAVGVEGSNIMIYKKGVCVAILDNSRRRIDAAFVVSEKRKRWRLKLVKE